MLISQRITVICAETCLKSETRFINNTGQHDFWCNEVFGAVLGVFEGADFENKVRFSIPNLFFSQSSPCGTAEYNWAKSSSVV